MTILDAPPARRVSPASNDANPDPADWPRGHEIDLSVHDMPHASSTLEWWYVNAHVQTVSGRQVSLFASFFRSAIGKHAETRNHVYAHALTWAIVDPAEQRYLSESLVDKDAPSIARQQLQRPRDTTDPWLKRAMLEVLELGQVPRPDQRLERACVVANDHLLLDFEGRCLERLSDGSYRLALIDSARTTGCELVFWPLKPVLRHGERGVVKGNSTESMFYYFSPRCALAGSITIDGVTEPLVLGSAWHEFGRSSEPGAPEYETSATAVSGVSWEWIGAQLDTGWDLTVYSMLDDASGDPCGRFAILIDPDGRPYRYESFTFEGGATWTSTRTFTSYPTAWSIRIPEAEFILDVRAAFPAQELVTMISRPAFWEGRVEIQGSHKGIPVSGTGFVERRGFEHTDSVPGFFAAVSRQTHHSVDALLPLHLGADAAARLVASAARPDYLDGLDLEQVARALVRPVRAIADRGGKAWRSYIPLTCCDAVGGDSQQFLDWLALPELMHVGSLIVDDVEDDSVVRRGGPAAHVLYGTGPAINAGSACYFLPHLFLENASLSDAHKLRVYELYMQCMRAAHTGQALDLDGFAALMPLVVEDGSGDELRLRVRAVHRLKSAAPASCLAQVGALLGGGTETQIAGLGAFVEAIGVAFQIMDDVLNISGFEGGLKARGEDVSAGKVTMPVAVAMARLQHADRQRLWSIIASKPRERQQIDEAIGLLESCGALGACRAEAEALVDNAWAAIDPLLPNTQAKLMLRAFGWYVLDRHY